MKINKIIILSIVSIFITSCSHRNYRMSTHVERNGSCLSEYHTILDSLPSITFSRLHSSGWEISQTDTTILNDNGSQKTKKSIRISKNFKSVEKMSVDTSRQKYCLTSKETLKKRFRWFYTYYAFTAVYPEVKEKGRVPMEQYLNKDEQKFLLQGDISAYRGMTGFELKEKLDELEKEFWNWYNRSMFEEQFDILLQFSDSKYHIQLHEIKDDLYSNTYGKEPCQAFFLSSSDIAADEWLDKFFNTDYFSKLFIDNKEEMNKLFEEKTEDTDELLRHIVQYELTLPGKLISTNCDQQNDGTLVWKVNMYKFLTDDYSLSAESRRANIWAFVVTLLLIVFSLYCFKKIKMVI